MGILLADIFAIQRVRIPILPPEIEKNLSADGEEYTISKLGKVNVPKPMNLPEFSFSSYFPGEKTHYSSVAFKNPKIYINQIEQWMERKQPIRFIYVGGSFTINDLVTIESFDYKDQFGTKDVDYSISFKKYVPFGFKKLNIVIQQPKPAEVQPQPQPQQPPVAAKKETEARPATNPAPKTYTLVKGDSLWKIAQKYTGNGANYKELQSLNGIKDSQLRKLPIGLVVKIPPSWTNG